MKSAVYLMTPATIEAPADFAGVSLRVILGYDPDDPFAVTLTFCGDEEERVTRLVARDLLRDGLARLSGTGSVAAWADGGHPDRYYLSIDTGWRPTVFSFQTHVVAGFLDEVYAVTPPGAEWCRIDLDAELKSILDNTT